MKKLLVAAIAVLIAGCSTISDAEHADNIRAIREITDIQVERENTARLGIDFPVKPSKGYGTKDNAIDTCYQMRELAVTIINEKYSGITLNAQLIALSRLERTVQQHADMMYVLGRVYNDNSTTNNIVESVYVECLRAKMPEEDADYKKLFGK